MRKLILAAGVAALAIAAPTAAKPGEGGNKGGGQAAQAHQGGGKGQGAKAERRGGGGGEARFAARGERRGGGGGDDRAANRGGRGGGGEQRANVERQRDRNDDKARGNNRGNNERVAQGNRGRDEQRVVRVDRDRDRDVNVNVRGRDRDTVLVQDFGEDLWEERFANRGLPRGFVGGCPPGLAFRDPPCVPPGHADEVLLGRVLPSSYSNNVVPLGLRSLYADTDDYYYRFGDGYMYRVDRDDNLISAILPLIGAGLGIGQPFPFTGANYMMPSYYQPFYPNMGDDYYRYANGYAYEIDGSTGLIEDVIPLLDRGYGIGQMLPASYSYYNVPYQYRSMYYDTPDHYYRYAPGAIYQVDRETQLITALVSLLTGGLGVGQTLPQSYSMYNVPLAYRSQYYDTPDAWYRYNNGYIYQVDPTTRLITAIVDAIV